MYSERTDNNKEIDFSSVLAAAVHDMKNSLFLLIQSIEHLARTLPEESLEAREQVASVHYEASRLNTNLVQILSLYRAEIERLPITVDECFIADLLHDVIDSNRLYIDQREISVSLDVDEQLSWYLDSELVYLLINDVVINAMKYGSARIRLSAGVHDNMLTIRIEDDGKGYPESMLQRSYEDVADFELSQGRTGLGLFFAKLIAAAHSQSDKRGDIALSNGGLLGGSVFEVKLP